MFKKAWLAIVRLPAILCVAALLPLSIMSCADDQARAQIADTNLRLSQMQQNLGVLDNKLSNQQVLDVLNKLDDLQNQINQLNGAVETLKHNQQSFQDTQKQINDGVDQQIKSLGGAGMSNNSAVASTNGNAVDGASNSGSASNTVVVKNSASSTTNASSSNNSGGVNNNSDDSIGKRKLKTGLNRLKSHDFAGAINSFNAAISSANAVRDASTSENANYYLAVSYVATHQYKQAITLGRDFVANNPRSRRSPDMLRTVYIAQTELGLKNAAKHTLKELHSNYPASEASRKLK